MRVMWTTARSGGGNATRVEWGPASGTGGALPYSAAAACGVAYGIEHMCNAPANQSKYFLDPGVVCDAVMTGLKPATRYTYRVGVEGHSAGAVRSRVASSAPERRPPSTVRSYATGGTRTPVT